MSTMRVTPNLMGLLLVRESDDGTEVRRALALLANHCERVLVGCTREGSEAIDARFDVITGHDVKVLNEAAARHPEKAWLVLTVQQCCVDEARVRFLIQYRSDDRPATVYTHDDHSMNPEYAIWENGGLLELPRSIELGEEDLLAALKRADHAHGCERLAPPQMTAPHKDVTETARLL